MNTEPQHESVDAPPTGLPPVKQNKPSFLESFLRTGQEAVKTADAVGKSATKQTQKFIEDATHKTGKVVNYLSGNWFLRKLAGVLNLSWLAGGVDNVNLDNAQAAVKKLQQEHPEESPSQISHRIMIAKATKAGGIGIATSIIPGEALALLAVDLAATTQLQSEMIYQIAAAYGLDLKDPARKGEVLAIFGLALGGGRLLKAAGLGLLRNIPFAGTMIAASTNATMIYSLGYAACRFYEAKLDDPSTSINSEQTLTQLKEQSENYLEKAIAQEAVMDQILVHMVLASNPEKTWSEILPGLQALKLSPDSLEAIAQNIKSPQPLDTLLNQLNRDFAVPLLAQCYRIAQFDGEITPIEQKVIEAITSKFNIDPNTIL
ncbi:EcsC family protein [Aetokthonos hydrillicola Thurmond2011]|uniref:EcsC family protein n=1 Tax=Aetokthonos hydrillicola Thurmond2011 TaxID=2712845 RepID=A0AAP5IEA1_9CYAN|nr:EcsC family protein [Aetokthonos hydrillicola CCALA 1050]MBW4587096.1 EcsC family protein [Aetokthonos hydrillicola CCALA 1050]MDR9899654.1 EcsC family protein [Aetokthonos hydrillicola Thurmond2011]